ncbi:ATP cone domain-containing protein, partial [Thalassospira sp.]|nr:transcriptional regulator NrdR [Thalassospira sp.]
SDISTDTIGEMVMGALIALDQVAYVRYASVYKNFREARDFEQFVENMHDGEEEADTE